MNIAKLQGMQMTELNAMAQEYGVENFGTMRKHEVIFHILAKKRGACRRAVLGRRHRGAAGRLRLPALAKFQLPALPEDIYVSPSQIRRVRSADRQR
jgi:transcription termination factor Rho